MEELRVRWVRARQVPLGWWKQAAQAAGQAAATAATCELSLSCEGFTVSIKHIGTLLGWRTV
eukprot:54435-Eustigmatos_ZCMA.PRE.1